MLQIESLLKKEIDFFTALTGSGEGWVAFFEDCLIEYAKNRGLEGELAERAIRQLFLGMGECIANSTLPVSSLVKKQIEYAGTTAAGLKVLKSGIIEKEIEKALDASYKKASSDMSQQNN